MPGLIGRLRGQWHQILQQICYNEGALWCDGLKLWPTSKGCDSFLMRVSVVHRTAWNISEDWLQVHSRTQLGQDSRVKCNFALVGPGFSRVAHWSRLCPVYACPYAGPSHHFSWWWQLVNLSPLSVERVDPQYSGASRCWHFLVLLVQLAWLRMHSATFGTHMHICSNTIWRQGQHGDRDGPVYPARSWRTS